MWRHTADVDNGHVMFEADNFLSKCEVLVIPKVKSLRSKYPHRLTTRWTAIWRVSGFKNDQNYLRYREFGNYVEKIETQLYY